MNKIDYYKINEVLNHKYYQIPQELFENSLYKETLDLSAKFLYGFILDRISLSAKHHWYDENGNIYLIFTRDEARNKLNLSPKTITKAFKQLIEADLIHEKRQGFRKPNLIFVGKIKHENKNNSTNTQNLLFKNSKTYTSGVVENTSLDTEFLPPINTNNINTDITNTNSINPNSDESSLNNIKEKCKLNELEKEINFLEKIVDKFKITVSKFIHWICDKFSVSSEDMLIRDFEKETHSNFNMEKQIKYEQNKQKELELE